MEYPHDYYVLTVWGINSWYMRLAKEARIFGGRPLKAGVLPPKGSERSDLSLPPSL